MWLRGIPLEELKDISHDAYKDAISVKHRIDQYAIYSMARRLRLTIQAADVDVETMLMLNEIEDVVEIQQKQKEQRGNR